jgi:hypothetical protein
VNTKLPTAAPPLVTKGAYEPRAAVVLGCDVEPRAVGAALRGRVQRDAPQLADDAGDRELAPGQLRREGALAGDATRLPDRNASETPASERSRDSPLEAAAGAA